MAFNPNIPQPTDQMSQSQADILDNFQFLNTIASGVFLAPPQLAAPVVPAGNNSLYTLNYADTGNDELWITNYNGVQTPLTANQNTVNGWTFLPSGLLMAWGQFSATGAAVFAYAGITNFPGFNNAGVPLNVQLTCVKTAALATSLVFLDSFSGNNTYLQLGIWVGNSAGGPAVSDVQFVVIGNPA